MANGKCKKKNHHYHCFLFSDVNKNIKQTGSLSDSFDYECRNHFHALYTPQLLKCLVMEHHEIVLAVLQ